MTRDKTLSGIQDPTKETVSVPPTVGRMPGEKLMLAFFSGSYRQPQSDEMPNFSYCVGGGLLFLTPLCRGKFTLGWKRRRRRKRNDQVVDDWKKVLVMMMFNSKSEEMQQLCPFSFFP